MTRTQFPPLTEAESAAAREVLTDIINQIYPNDPDRVQALLAEYADNPAEAAERFTVYLDERLRHETRRAGRDARGRFVSNDLTVGQALAAIQDAVEDQQAVLSALFAWVRPARSEDDLRTLSDRLASAQEAINFLRGVIPLTDAGTRPRAVQSSEEASG